VAAGGFPQTIGAIAGFTTGGGEVLPLLVSPSGDGFTGLLEVGGITATIGFPYPTTADGQSPAAAAGSAIFGFNGITLDRIRVGPANGVPGVLLVQGAVGGAPLLTSAPYDGRADGQTPQANSAFEQAALNAAGTVDRVRVANLGQNLAAATPGIQVVQGASSGVPLPVTGSFVSSYPYDMTEDNQTATPVSAIALVAFDGTNMDRVRVANMGAAVAAATPGVLTVQSSPNASPFPINPIGQGALFPVPAGGTNGVVIGAQPAGSQGIRIYVPPNCNFIYTIAPSQPSAPAQVVTMFNPSTAQFPVVVDENLNGQNLYVISPTVANTALVARWI
jgi:hypothetical protein